MNQTVLDSLNQGLLNALGRDDHVLLLGEDILDPYGGAFKVTRGCSSGFPDRVISTPISEAGITGVAAGLALRGDRPVVEIMFGDFTTLIADQLINHIAKFRWMYNNTVDLPLVIRAPMGGRRGYGPTHSQTLEKHFLGVPGVKVIAPANITLSQPGSTPGGLLELLILETREPVLFVENKLQYLLPVYDASALTDFTIESVGSQADAPAWKLGIKGAPGPRVTVAAYGYMAELARQAILRLAYEEELFAELVIYTQLSPFGLDPLQDSLARTGRLVTVEEGGLSLGWGAELLARAVESVPVRALRAARVAALDLPVAAAPSLEQVILPQVVDLMAGIRKVAGA
jgi:acetoin:2,6-dichlorophenolindophenol oxidoreductase subunit beta